MTGPTSHPHTTGGAAAPRRRSVAGALAIAGGLGALGLLVWLSAPDEPPPPAWAPRDRAARPTWLP